MLVNNDWIPVNKNLPEANKCVQVTYIGIDGNTYCDEFAYVRNGKWFWWRDSDLDDPENGFPIKVKVEITAWKPMCEPYKA